MGGGGLQALGQGACGLTPRPDLPRAPSLCQQQLPATGVPITHQRFDQMRDMFDDYVRTRTLHNWKFWVVSSLGQWRGERCSRTRLGPMQAPLPGPGRVSELLPEERAPILPPPSRPLASWPAALPSGGLGAEGN